MKAYLKVCWLLGAMGIFTRSRAKSLAQTLPAFDSFSPASDLSIPSVADDLNKNMLALEHLAHLVDWWNTNRAAFRDAWASLLGTKDGSGKFPTDSLEGKLHALETSLDRGNTARRYRKGP
jgi:hypothetical protein